mmetsp:Transcript_24513/g.40867  ORF Transcript_24513/g.40867 Transcript_24513/m.40867 type:complete len:204 (-) Transcript_24513:50-661(-)
MSKLIQQKAAEAAAASMVVSLDGMEATTAKRKRNTSSLPVTKGGKGAATKKAKQSEAQSSVIYLGHIPHGFYEDELKKFFSQFGIVRKLKLFRSPRTGRSRGFAFLEFESPETAATVSESLHGYFLHGRQLVSHVIPSSKHHDGMWKTKKPEEENEEEEEEPEKLTNTNMKDKKELKAKKESMKRQEKQQRLEELGIEFTIAV